MSIRTCAGGPDRRGIVVNSAHVSDKDPNPDQRVTASLPEAGIDQLASKVLEQLEHLPAQLSAMGDDTTEVEVNVIALPPRGR